MAQIFFIWSINITSHNGMTNRNNTLWRAVELDAEKLILNISSVNSFTEKKQILRISILLTHSNFTSIHLYVCIQNLTMKFMIVLKRRDTCQNPQTITYIYMSMY